jgi:hypothetical protein
MKTVIENINEKGEQRECEINKIFEKDKKNVKVYKRSISHVILGISLILIALLIFITFSIWIIISKLSPPADNSNIIIKFIAEDKHYCLAIPILIPITIIVAYMRWVSFSYFKNS